LCGWIWLETEIDQALNVGSGVVLAVSPFEIGIPILDEEFKMRRPLVLLMIVASILGLLSAGLRADPISDLVNQFSAVLNSLQQQISSTTHKQVAGPFKICRFISWEPKSGKNGAGDSVVVPDTFNPDNCKQWASSLSAPGTYRSQLGCFANQSFSWGEQSAPADAVPKPPANNTCGW
jgi:hypothetical protein